jgi:hypothetical protein
MKLQALIIFLSILVYTTEQVKIPLMVGSNHNKMMCCKAKMKCHKKMTNKPTNNCDGSNCINCPLGNIFTLQSISSTSVFIPQFKKEFVPLKTNLVSGVYWKVWRPPVVS